MKIKKFIIEILFVLFFAAPVLFLTLGLCLLLDDYFAWSYVCFGLSGIFYILNQHFIMWCIGDAQQRLIKLEAKDESTKT